MRLELDLISYEESVGQSVKKDCEESGWAVRHHTAVEKFLSLSDASETRVLVFVVPDAWSRKEDRTGLEALRKWKQENTSTQLILLSPADLERSDRLATKLAARHLLRIPYETKDLHSLLAGIAQGLGKRRQKDEVSRRLSMKEGFEEIIGSSERMKEVIELAKKVSSSDYTAVMITGENGTGKGALAKAIHSSSDRADGPFIEVNCAAIPKNLLESEFFGYEKGAFTDARERKMGLFELANGGTIFLDEIGEIDYNLQAKLLKFLDSRTIRRISGTQFLPVDVRIISATNRDLKDEIGSNRFRVDLFYRLNVIEINIPPLRERREDIKPIALTYTERFSRRMKKEYVTLDEKAVELLETYSWPGNIRELINMLERAVLLNTTGVISPKDLPISRPARETTANISATGESLRIDIPREGISLDRIEKSVITKALSMTSGNISRAADLLRVERGTLRYKMKKHGIDAGSFKENSKTGEYEPLSVSD